jgi:ubiquinone/menaquinone biosynthesis C-methylase UbiE
VGFGLGIVDVDAGFRELRRMLKPGVRLVVLISLPGASPVPRPAALGGLPLIGRIVSKYGYLHLRIPYCSSRHQALAAT